MKKPSKDSNLGVFKAIILSLMLILVTFSIMVEAYDENSQNLKLNYYFNNPEISTIMINDYMYDIISLPNCYTAGDPGEPDIPSFGAFILLPPESEVDKINIEVGNKISLGFDFYIKPLGQVLPISQSYKIKDLVADKSVYEKDEYYPGNLYSNIGTYSFRGYNILVLQLHPMQYNPVTGKLFYYEDLQVSVDTSHIQKTNLFRGLEKDRLEVQKKVDNPEISVKYFDNKKTLSNEDYDLLILTTDTLKSGFNPLKSAHDAEGINTVIKTLTDVGGSSTEDIRNYIRDAYSNWGVDYVLLGGDYDVLPYRELWVSGLDEGTEYYDTYMPSDLYYSCLDGTYNYDGDNKWGEPTDGIDGNDVDLFADVFVGRACVDDIDDVNFFVSKTNTYINKDPSWEYLTKACFAAEYLGDYGIASWGGNYLDQLIDICTDDNYTTTGIPSANYTITKLYDRDLPGNYWDATDLMDIIDDGIHFLNHDGHSWYDYNMRMDNSDIYSLSNSDHCFIYSQGCMAGGFDDPWGFDCFAEECTVKTDTGAFAGIWNARYGWFWSYSTDGDSQRFHRQFWDAVFGDNIFQIGRANSASKEANLPIITRSCIRWCYYQTNLFGDPSLSFFDTNDNIPPEIPEIDGPLEGKIGKTYNYDFTIYDADLDFLYLKIEWGDNTSEDWIGPFENGVITKSHTWEEEGNYSIRAMVRDENYAESGWGYLDVTMPKNQLIDKPFYIFLQNYPIIFRIFKNILNLI